MNTAPTYWDKRREEKNKLKARFMAAVAAHVRPLGFTGPDKVLSRPFPSGNLAVIYFQLLTSPDKAEVRPSIGIASAKLARALKPTQKRLSRDIHCGEFVRDLGKDLIEFPAKGDASIFELRTDEEADLAAQEVNRFLDERGFQWLEEHSEDSVIVKEVKGGRGMTGTWAAILDDLLCGRPPGTSVPPDPFEKFYVRVNESAAFGQNRTFNLIT